MPTSPDPPIATGAETLAEVLADAAERGFPGQFDACDDGTVRCDQCQAATAATEITVEGVRRLEGASDPADLQLSAWFRCPRCGAGGVLTVGYGPNAGEADQAVLVDLSLDGAARGPVEDHED